MIGQWDEDAQTLSYVGTDPNQVTVTTVLRYLDHDRVEWQGIWRDQSGSIVMEINGTATRRK